MGLQQFEHRLERLVEGAFAKAFRGELQPIELGRRLTREMDLLRTVGVRGMVAPNFFSILLSREDYERFSGIISAIAYELVAVAQEHGNAERYAFVGPVEVEIGWSEQLKRSTFTVTAEIREGETVLNGWLVVPDGRRYQVGDAELTIGRLNDCDVPLVDPNVSRHHAQIRRDGDAVYLVDLSSTNGTRVNGHRVRSQRLSSGDVITIGATSLRYETT